MEPKFETYSFEELVEAHKNIDKDAFPERFQKISHLIEQKRLATPTTPSHQVDSSSQTGDEQDSIYTKPPVRELDKDGNYIPNKIPLNERLLSLVIALFLLIYGFFGLYQGEIYIPSRRGGGIHLYAESLWIMFAALICGFVVFVTIVIDHYDKRDNEHKYYKFGRSVKYLGIACFAVAAFWELLAIET
jgi:hypothetical protein